MVLILQDKAALQPFEHRQGLGQVLYDFSQISGFGEMHV